MSTQKGSDYASVNPNNLWLIFTQEQMINSLHAMELFEPVLCASVSMDQEQLNNNILLALPTNPLFIALSKDPKPHWPVSSNGFLHHDNLFYIPDSNDLQLRILHYKHAHILSGHPGQNKTIKLIWQDYT